jgi:YaiO family outer membrane protein
MTPDHILTSSSIVKLRMLATFIVCMAFRPPASAQDWKDQDTDAIFNIARQEAFAGNFEASRQKLDHILEKFPHHFDARLLKANTLSWGGSFDEARILLVNLATQFPDNREVFNSLADLELWNHRYDDALLWINKALAQSADDEKLLFKKATALNGGGRPDEAMICLERILALDPSNGESAALLRAISAEKRKYTIGVHYMLDVFDRTFRPAQNIAMQIARINSWGTASVRVNVAQRFQTTGVQLETESYPKITRHIYGYLNYGYSTSPLFPHNRIGGEAFTRLPRRLEASAGIRYLDYDSHNALIYTGSVGCYFKHYWVSVRPYINRGEHAAGASATVSARRYFRDSQNYMGFTAGLGFSPDYTRFQSSYGLGNEKIYTSASQRCGVSLQKVFRSHWIMNVAFEVARQEVSGDGDYMVMTTSALGLRKKF